MISSCTHVATNGISFFMAESYSIACKYPIFFIHSSVRAHPGCFHVLATVNSAAKNIGMPFGIVVFSGYMPQSGTAGSYDSSRYCLFQKVSSVLHFPSLPRLGLEILYSHSTPHYYMQESCWPSGTLLLL